ncbi:MAG: glycosyltransferase family 39 protein [Eubacteriales bacterium]|nr:glycosyltransferase family 39 protein [Eubacteriales bacterium]
MTKTLKRASTLGYALALTATLLLAAFLLFDGLGTRPFDSWDEARHGQSAYEMLQSGDWIVTTYLGEPDYWNLKPPLSMWGDAIGFAVFGYNPLGLRIASSGLMFVTYLLMAWYVHRRYGRLESLVVLWLFCACRVVYYLHFARTGQADGYSTAFFLISLMALMDSERDVRSLYVCALCFGLSFLARSWHAFLIPGVCLVTLVVTGRIRKLKPKHYLALIGLGLLPILPWAVLRYARDGWTFFRGMLEYDLLKRSGEAIEGHVESPWYYFQYLAQYPTAILAACLCVAAAARRLIRRARPRFDETAVAVAVLLPLVLFSAAETKIDRYAFPTLAALLLGGGVAAGRLTRDAAALWRRQKRLPACALSLGLAACVAVAGTGVAENVRTISRLRANDPYQNALGSVINAQSAAPDGGKLRVYTLMENGWPEWRPSDILLTSILCGDVNGIERLNGGMEPFLSDPGAWIVTSNVFVTDELRAACVCHYDDGFVSVLENKGE